MDPFVDYQDEVERLSDDQIEVILSGQDHSSRPLTTLVREVRIGLLEYPSPEITARHIAAMTQANPPALHGNVVPAARLERRNVMRRRRLAAMVLAAALLLVAGLAAAVTLPRKAAPTPEDTVPATAPSVTPAPQARDEAAHGQDVSRVAKDPSLTGCEKGQAVADVASAKAAGKGNGEMKNDPCARNENQGKPNPGRRGEVPTGHGDGSKGRKDTRPAGSAGPKTAPGRDDEGVGSSEAGGGKGRVTPDSQGGGGSGVQGGGRNGGVSRAGGV